MSPHYTVKLRDILRAVEKGELSQEDAFLKAKQILFEEVKGVIALIKKKAITSEEGVCDLRAFL